MGTAGYPYPGLAFGYTPAPVGIPGPTCRPFNGIWYYGQEGRFECII